MNRSIMTVDDVKDFFIYLIRQKKVSLNPDDDFNAYIDYTSGKNIFTKSEADDLNNLMVSCFTICEDGNVDIYDFMNQILLKESGLDKI